MYFGLANYPAIDFKKINFFRKKYDPTFELIEPHIGIMFPVSESIGKINLINHVEKILQPWQPFQIHIRGFVKSWDHWLFLTLEEGNSKVIQLYEEIYSGILSKFQRKDITFIPHIGLGFFAKDQTQYDYSDPQSLELDKENYEKALAEAKKMELDYRCTFDRLHLVKISENFSKFEIEKEFKWQK